MSNKENIHALLTRYPIDAAMFRETPPRHWKIQLRWDDGFNDQVLTFDWTQSENNAHVGPDTATVIDTVVGDRHSFINNEWDEDELGTETYEAMKRQTEDVEAFFEDRLDEFTYG